MHIGLNFLLNLKNYIIEWETWKADNQILKDIETFSNDGSSGYNCYEHFDTGTSYTRFSGDMT